MTRTPDSVSRITRLIRSILICIAWNSGIARLMTAPISSGHDRDDHERIRVSGTSWR